MLDNWQKTELLNDGYTIIRKLIPKDLVSCALKTINMKLGEAALSRTSDLGEFSPDCQCYDKDIVNLLHKSPLSGILNNLFGNGNAGTPNSAQVALRFPTTTKSCESWHIDGEGELLPFNLLVGISLFDQSPGGGCLFGYPGSHLKVQKHFGNLKALKLDNPCEILLNAGDVILMHQMTAHFVGNNLSDQIRYQVYFRIWHRDLNQQKRLIKEYL